MRRRKWSYLLLGLALSVSPRWRRESQLTFPILLPWRWAVSWPTLRAQVVPFTFNNLPRENLIQLALQFRDCRADDALADRIAESIWALHTLVSGGVLTDLGITAYRVPRLLLRGRKQIIVSSASVIDWDSSRPFEERRDWQSDPSLTNWVSVSSHRFWT